MTGYADKTFCPFDKCGNWLICSLALTDKVKQEAEKWWGKPAAPIAVFTDKPKCYTEEPLIY